MIEIENEADYLRVAQIAERERQWRERLLNGESTLEVLGYSSTLDYTRLSLIDNLCERVQDCYASMEAYDRRVHGDRKGDWFPLFSMRRFWPEDPRPEDIDIHDIARGLSRINRFNGQTKGPPYPVAQHSVYASYLFESPFSLMHDSGETYLGDMVTPVKRLIKELYEPLEEGVMQAVATKYGFTMLQSERDSVKKVDLIMLSTEVRDLTPCGILNPKINKRIELPRKEPIKRCWSPEEAEERFLKRFEELCGQRA